MHLIVTCTALHCFFFNLSPVATSQLTCAMKPDSQCPSAHYRFINRVKVSLHINRHFSGNKLHFFPIFKPKLDLNLIYIRFLVVFGLKLCQLNVQKNINYSTVRHMFVFLIQDVITFYKMCVSWVDWLPCQ